MPVAAISAACPWSRATSTTFAALQAARLASAVPQAPAPITAMRRPLPIAHLLATGSSFAVMSRIDVGIEGPPRPRSEGQIVALAEQETLNADPGNHRTIVRAKL